MRFLFLSVVPVSSVGDFLTGQTSVRPPTPMEADGHRTALPGSLAGRGVAFSDWAGEDGGRGHLEDWRAFCWLGLLSFGWSSGLSLEGCPPAFRRAARTDGKHDCPGGRAGQIRHLCLAN